MHTSVLKFFALSLLLVGCGGGSGGGSGTADAPSSSSTVGAGGSSSTGGTGGSSSTGGTGGSASTVRMQAMLGPLAGADVKAYRMSDLGRPGAVPVFTTTTRVGSTLAEAGTFDFNIPSAQSAVDEAYVIVISGGRDVDPSDVGVRVAPENEAPFQGSIQAIALRSDLMNMDRSDIFRINALTETAYQILQANAPADGHFTAEFLASQLDAIAQVQLVGRTGDLNGDNVVNRLDLASFHPIDDIAQLAQGDRPFRALTGRLLAGTASSASSSNLNVLGDLSAAGFASGSFVEPAGLAGRCQAGSAFLETDQKSWLRSWMHYNYLWSDEFVDIDPVGQERIQGYFDKLTELSDPTKDRFHYAVPGSLSSTLPGYDGVLFAAISNFPPRDIRAVHVAAGSPAALAGITRGSRITSVNGTDIVNTQNVGTELTALFLPVSGVAITLRVNDQFNAGLTATDIPALRLLESSALTVGDTDVGYVALANLYRAPTLSDPQAESAAVRQLALLADGGGIDELVVDMRYYAGNPVFPGSASDIGTALASMIAGPARARSQIFAAEAYSRNAIVGLHAYLTSIAYQFFPLNFADGGREPLPDLQLDRVFVITGAASCSATERFINGLRGVGVDVVQIGPTTCGNPFILTAAENCGTVWSAITGRVVNARGWGAYDAGFSPGIDAGPAPRGTDRNMPGCVVNDDLGNDLGDPDEAGFDAVLNWIDRGSCTP